MQRLYGVARPLQDASRIASRPFQPHCQEVSMRKIAPVFIAASIFAASGTAFALGDKRDKPAPNTASTSSVPASSGGTAALPKSGTPASDATTSGASMGANSSSGMSASATPDKPAGAAKTPSASNDPAKCDVTRYATRAEMPKDCLDGRAGGAAVGSTQGQSGGAGAAGGSSGAGSSGGAGSGGSSK
jgi:hypothetical protein